MIMDRNCHIPLSPCWAFCLVAVPSLSGCPCRRGVKLIGDLTEGPPLSLSTNPMTSGRHLHVAPNPHDQSLPSSRASRSSGGFVAAGSKMACSSPYHSRSCTRSSKGKRTRRGVPAFQLCAFEAGLRRHEQGTDTAVSVMVKVVPPQPRRTADICTGCMVKLGAAGTKYWSLADRMCRLCKE